MSLIYAVGTPQVCDLLIEADAAQRERKALEQKVANGDVATETMQALAAAILRDTQATAALHVVQETPAPNPPVPRTHALVIGVGDYPHLRNGTLTLAGQPAAVSLSLGQLTSPPVSAGAFADWMVTRFRNDERPLGTVELLLSPGIYKPGEAAYGKLGLAPAAEIPVENATLNNIRAAFSRWLARCNGRHTTALFYFCGHGVSKGEASLLLPEDFGADPTTPFDRCIDLTATHRFMGQALPDAQYFFIDACREEPFELLTAQEKPGVTLKGGTAAPFRDRDAPIFAAAARSKKAHGPDHGVSYFTQGLIRCLDGVGARKKAGQWRVASPHLHEGLEVMLERIEQENADKKLDLSKGVGGESNMVQPIHFPVSGRVLIDVTCVPDTALPQADLYILDAQGNRVSERKHQPTPWLHEIPAGHYRVGADFPTGSTFACPPGELTQIAPPDLDEPWTLMCQ